MKLSTLFRRSATKMFNILVPDTRTILERRARKGDPVAAEGLYKLDVQDYLRANRTPPPR